MSAAASSPERRAVGPALRRRRRSFSPWLIIPIIVALAAGGLLTWQLTRGSTPTVQSSTAQITTGDLSLSVSGSGTVQPAQTRSVAFAVSGTVAEVLVAVGDRVSAGQPLATLDLTELEMEVRQAEANLKSAQANLAATNGEGATEAEREAAAIQLTSAQAQLSQTLKGDTTAAELASAEAQLASARAQLNELLAGPDADSLSSARASVEQAQLSLESQKNSLSVAKTRAQGEVTAAANSLRDLQDDYSTLYWQNRDKEDSGMLTQADVDSEAAALRAVQNAEVSLQQAQLAYDQAVEDERTGTAQAESDLRLAQEQLRTVEEGATPAELASARASVASAESNLASLRRGATAEEIAIAQASVDQARLSLDQLSAPESEASIAGAEASLAQAEVALEQARLNLERATLTAPFAGTVSALAINPGDSASSSTTITLIDESSYYVELSLSESDAGQVAVGQAVELTFDALSDVALEGIVEMVAPTATVTQNVATYTVRVSFKADGAAIRSGMTASGTIIVEERAGILLAPTRAIQSQGGSQVVQVQPAAGQPAVAVQVETGLSSDGMTEILSCVETGTLCLQEGDTLVISSSTSSSTTTSSQSNTLGGGLGGGGFSGPPPGP